MYHWIYLTTNTHELVPLKRHEFVIPSILTMPKFQRAPIHGSSSPVAPCVDARIVSSQCLDYFHEKLKDKSQRTCQQSNTMYLDYTMRRKYLQLVASSSNILASHTQHSKNGCPPRRASLMHNVSAIIGAQS